MNRVIGSLISVCVCLNWAFVGQVDAEEIGVWLGTGNAKKSKGIYYCTLNTETGKLSESRLVAEVNGPGFLAHHPSLDVLYAVGKPIGGEHSVVAYSIDRSKNPTLRFLDSAPIGDGGACHLSIDPTGKMLATAQYGGGSVAAFSLATDGSIEKRTELIGHEGGSKVVGRRQHSSHAHFAGFALGHRFLLVPDLGLDRVVIYQSDVLNGSLQRHGEGVTPPGSGPRHMKFHQNGKWIYVLNELALTMSVFYWDEKAGKMDRVQTIPTVPEKELAKEVFKSASEVRVHPSGRFLYSANRGHDTITVYKIDQQTGKLAVVEVENARCATPRNFNISPDGKWLLVAGQDSHTLGVFSVDQETGELAYNQSIISTPAPICVLFDKK